MNDNLYYIYIIELIKSESFWSKWDRYGQQIITANQFIIKYKK